MGCGNSQAVEVVNTTATVEKKENINYTTSKPNNSFASIPKSSHNDLKKDYNQTEESTDKKSNKSSRSSRNTGSPNLDDEYKNVITEKSNQNKVVKVERDFMEKNNLDVFISGKSSLPPLLMKKENIISKENNDVLRNTGLVSTNPLIKRNFVQFEIVDEKLVNNPSNTNGSVLMPKIVLPKLQREKTQTNLTTEKILEKIEKANQRKMENLKHRTVNQSIELEKKQFTLKNSQRVNYEDSNIKGNYSNEQEFNKDFVERQKRLQEIRDKLKAKDSNVQVSTPRSKELINELENFRPKTSTNFRPEF